MITQPKVDLGEDLSTDKLIKENVDASKRMTLAPASLLSEQGKRKA
jgi:hypothetical protein